MKKLFLVIVLLSGIGMLLMTSLVVMSCRSDDEKDIEQNVSALYGRWVLQGYVSKGNFISYENSGAGECYLILEKDGKFNGQFCNQLQGEYSSNKKGEFHILSCFSTQVWSTDSDLMFMEDQIMIIRSFELEGNDLRLYYSTNDYLKFSR